jgi:hypothetical protein
MERFASSSTIGFFPFGLGIIVEDATTFGLM